MLGNVALIVLMLLLVQLLVAAAWFSAVPTLRLSRVAARHWAVSALAGAVAAGLMLARGSAPDWLAVGLANSASVLAALAMRRGALVFLRLPVWDGEAVVALALVLLGSLACAWLPLPLGAVLQVALSCGALGWVLLRMSAQTYPAMRTELGGRAAFLLIAPQVAAVAMFALRAAASLAPQSAGLRPLPEDTPLNLASALMLLVLVLVQHASLATMALMRVVRKLRHLSQRDSLTGLYNRAEWTRQLESQHRWLGRFGEPFGVLIIDIDHFKKINDTMGHAAGDAVLLTVAQVLLASARDVDVIGRLGGEEFGVLLPRAEPSALRRTGERLRQMLGDAETTWRGQPIRLTVSIGAALCTDVDESPAHVLERADQALYQAKHNGRNRTVVARLAG